jgi:glycosyltransferase involved in cell wall biosynthesis
MKKIAIVSSYDESCGNAYFTEALVSTINKSQTGWAAEPVGLNLNLNQNLGRLENQAADDDIKRITEYLKKFDSVNIQFESQLFGLIPSQIKRRLRFLLSSNKNIFVTYHSPRVTVDFKQRKEAIRQLMSLRLLSALRSELNNYRSNFDVHMNRQIIRMLSKRNIPVIVHTKKSQQALKQVFNHGNVHVHPLQFADKSRVNLQKVREIRPNLGLPEDAMLLGLFGYISKYKGHMEALEAVRALPDEYHLVIAGRQHPQTLGNDDATGYLRQLVRKVARDPQLRDRTHFAGELSNSDFEALVSSVDCCILPYHEVGQDGSGIASICFELGQRVLASNSFAFDELFKLVPEYRSPRFDVYNHLELAEKIQIAVSASVEAKGSGKYSLDTQAELYLKLSQSQQ